MKNPISRRHLLRGAGGATLALPFLPSMAGRRGFAAAGGPHQRSLIALATHHGGVWADRMFPDADTLDPVLEYAGRTVHAAPLVGEVSGGRRSLSPVLTADATRLTDRLVSQMGVLRGLDIPWYIAHHTGGHLGNFARNDGNGADGVTMQAVPTPTIDQVLAWSSCFYSDPDAIVERTMTVGAGRLSYWWANPQARTGVLQAQPAYTSSLALFQRVFDPGAAYGAATPLAVDRVMDGYRALLADPRLSAGDRRRLDAHMERLFEVQRRIAMDVPCVPLEPAWDAESLQADPAWFRDPDSQIAYWQLMIDVVVAALSCGVSHIATLHAAETFSTFAGDWHQDIAHQAYLADGEAQDTLATAHQRFFEGVFLDLVEKLDATEGPSGGSLLDDSLVLWTQESGAVPHESMSIPVVTAGSAGGAVNPGQSIDFRDRTREVAHGDAPNATNAPGLLWYQYLGTVLQSMGASPAEYETDVQGGYGLAFVAEDTFDYADALGVLSEPLPLFT